MLTPEHFNDQLHVVTGSKQAQFRIIYSLFVFLSLSLSLSLVFIKTLKTGTKEENKYLKNVKAVRAGHEPNTN